MVVANLAMEDVEESSLPSSPHKPPFWRRYGDDTRILMVTVSVTYEHLNSVEPLIKFTFDVEQDHKLSFLDVEVLHHLYNSLSTKVFRIATHTDKYVSAF